MKEQIVEKFSLLLEKYGQEQEILLHNYKELENKIIKLEAKIETIKELKESFIDEVL